MPFSAETKVLTKDGYVNISELSIGTVLPTPLGDTTVKHSFKFSESKHLPVGVDDNVVVSSAQTFLTKDKTWKRLYNESLRKVCMLTGILNQREEDPPITSNDVFTFNESCEFIFHDFSNKVDDKWYIATENGIAVIGNLVAYTGFSLPEDFEVSDEKVLTLPEDKTLNDFILFDVAEITDEQLTTFKGSHFS